MKTKYTYSVESFFLGKLVKILSDTRDFCMGYLFHAQYSHPRNELRIVRSDGTIVHELSKDDNVGVGMVAGWPTPEQYEYAEKLALEQADRISARMKQ